MDEWSGQGDLEGLLDAHRRIFAAFEGIAAGTEALAARGILRNGTALAPRDDAEVERLRAEIEEERTANAQLAERVRALREREDNRVAALEDDLARARAEVAAVVAARAADRAEIDEILAALTPLVAEAV